MHHLDVSDIAVVNDCAVIVLVSIGEVKHGTYSGCLQDISAAANTGGA